MGWNPAEYAATASEQAKAICCGKQDCFRGRGCDTARWITLRLEKAGYLLARNPRLTLKEPADDRD